jgi:hypothetical protein
MSTPVISMNLESVMNSSIFNSNKLLYTLIKIIRYTLVLFFLWLQVHKSLNSQSLLEYAHLQIPMHLDFLPSVARMIFISLASPFLQVSWIDLLLLWVHMCQYDLSSSCKTAEWESSMIDFQSHSQMVHSSSTCT